LISNLFSPSLCHFLKYFFRFVHPGVLDKGNYNMFAPARAAAHNGPPPFERPFERPPPVMPMIPPAPEWVPPPRIANPRPPRSHTQVKLKKDDKYF